MKIYTLWTTLIFSLFFLASQTGCSSSTATAKSVSNASAYPRILKRADGDKRYLIMYSGVDTYHVKSVQVEKSKQQFTVHLTKVDSLHATSLRNPGNTTAKLLQMYMRDSTSYTLDEPHTIPMNRVAKIDLGH
ncbi:hypothetical protein EXU57_08075 [Segetibacter sp. 3557_3]|uniref:hypothetical protein n=1 Tax=Segetibacter sp. 3557_3 TaxID=2547429 RepID=UPI00105866A2|nr:hypothetical protein [Segetibacter sp. 3557_3]TDH26764.1 hypothetical protein EXU57_08075 [Segetibacter sp. 3557_3]